MKHRNQEFTWFRFFGVVDYLWLIRWFTLFKAYDEHKYLLLEFVVRDFE
jgi:hypothetical protein